MGKIDLEQLKREQIETQDEKIRDRSLGDYLHRLHGMTAYTRDKYPDAPQFPDEIKGTKDFTFVPEGAKDYFVVDLACGRGRFLKELQQKADTYLPKVRFTTMGIDILDPYAGEFPERDSSRSRKDHPDFFKPYDTETRLDHPFIMIGDIQTAQIRTSAKPDLITSVYGFCYTRDPLEGILNWVDQLKDGGIFFADHVKHIYLGGEEFTQVTKQIPGTYNTRSNAFLLQKSADNQAELVNLLSQYKLERTETPINDYDSIGKKMHENTHFYYKKKES